MTRGKHLAFFSYLPLIVLPAVHVFLVALTIALSVKLPGGAYYRIIGVDPLAAAVMMVYDDTPIVVGALLIFGTAWWYFIGWIGWKSSKGRISRLTAGLGAILALFFGVIGTTMSKDVLFQDLHDGALSAGAILQYACVGVICLGAFVTTTCSAMVALQRKKLGAFRTD